MLYFLECQHWFCFSGLKFVLNKKEQLDKPQKEILETEITFVWPYSPWRLNLDFKCKNLNCSCPSFPSHSTLEGFYVDDALQGQGVYTYEDGGVLNGTYVDGELNGPAQEFDGQGHLVFKGQYKDNNRCGECWVYYPVSQLTV